MLTTQEARNLPEGTVVYVTDRAWRFGVEKYTYHLHVYDRDNVDKIAPLLNVFSGPGSGYSARQFQGWSTWRSEYADYERFRHIQPEDAFLNPQEAAKDARKKIQKALDFFSKLYHETADVLQNNIEVYERGEADAKVFSIEIRDKERWEQMKEKEEND